MSQSVEEPVTDHSDEPYDRPNDWPIARLARLGRGADDTDADDDAEDGGEDGGDDDADGDRGRPAHLRAIVVTALTVVVVGLIAGIVVFNSSAPPLGRGAESARGAATRFVHAIDAGDAGAAARISCDSFTDDARALARSGADKGITFGMGKLHQVSRTDAVVVVTETLTLPGGHTHSSPTTLAITESGSRWLVCGRSG